MTFGVPHESANPHARLLQHAAELRERSLRTRIQALGAFCTAAESELGFKHLDRAQSSLKKIRHAVAEIEHHLQDPHHASPEAAPELHAMLEKTKPRIERLATSIRSRI